jgi:LacI family transcriptional regulator
MKKHMTMKDIARKMGVSQTTVSVTLSGKANAFGISPDTQQRIVEFVQRTGYVPDSHAADVAGRGKRRIGILVPYSLTENQTAILSKLTQNIPLNDAVPMIYSASKEVFSDAIRFMAGSKVSDIVIIGAGINIFYSCPEIYSMIEGRRIYMVDFPFPRFDDVQVPLKNIVKIGIDRKQSYLDAVVKLENLGHRKIGVVDHGWHFLNGGSGYNGKAEIVLITCEAFRGDNYYVLGSQVLPEILKLMEEGVTAVMMGDDQVAIGLIAALLDTGKRVPSDISVLGFDNIDVAPYIRVPLATIDVPKERIIERLMTNLFLSEDAETRHVLKGELILRESVGIAPRK